MSHHINISFDKNIIDQRIRARISLAEFFAIGFALSMVGVFIWLEAEGHYYPCDFYIYMDTVRGNYQDYFYASWAVPFYYLFAWIPNPIGYFLWNALNILCVFYAARIFGGKAPIVLLSYQFLYLLFYGQITGLIVGFLALFWWAAANKRWDLAGFGLLMAATKFQLGILVGGALWLIADLTWRDRLRILVVPIVGLLLSFMLYPDWVGQLFSRLVNNPPNNDASISLWRYIGPYSLLLLPFALILPLKKEERMLAFLAAVTLSLPYFQQADLISLFIFPTGYIFLLGYLGILFTVFNTIALQAIFIVPLSLLIFIAVRGILRHYFPTGFRSGATVNSRSITK